MRVSIVTVIISAVGGASLFGLVKILIPEVSRYFHNYIESRKAFFNSLSPLLRVSSELYGKMLSLSNEDFATFTNPKKSNSSNPIHNKKYIYYLFAQFWAHLEYLRNQSQYVEISKFDKGLELLRFIETVESREHRILDRSIQRIIGESLIMSEEKPFKIMSLKEFVSKIDDEDSDMYKWIQLLDKKIGNLKHSRVKQDLLVFGLIAAIFIDHFDPEYKSVRRRKIYLNKLDEKSRAKIKKSLLGHYLPFVKQKFKYYQVPSINRKARQSLK